jgi:hypothetical protein
MAEASQTIDWGVMLAVVMAGANAIFYFAVWRGRLDAQAQNLAAILSNKADRHEVQAVDKRVDALERLVSAEFAEFKSTLRESFVELKQSLAAEHARRSDEHNELQWSRGELQAKVAALEAKVFGAPQRRAEDRASGG